MICFTHEEKQLLWNKHALQGVLDPTVPNLVGETASMCKAVASFGLYLLFTLSDKASLYAFRLKECVLSEYSLLRYSGRSFKGGLVFS